MKTLLVITGPTASGKTGLAVTLARELGTSIISADSRQCYKSMSIGTAQPSPEELGAVRHYYVAEFPVTETQNAASFERLAMGYLEEIFADAETAILCGGTGLYIRSLCEGLDDMPPVDQGIAEAVDQGYREHGIGWLQDAILTEDPSFTEGSEWQNPARLLRALSFLRSTGKSIVSFQSGKKKVRPFRIVKVGLELPREQLYQRINQRTAQMIRAGLADEVRSLLPYRECSALQTVGYTEMFDFLDGKCSLESATDKIRQHTRNYAKRQLTWMRKEKDLHWLPADEPGLSKKVIQILNTQP